MLSGVSHNVLAKTHIDKALMDSFNLNSSMVDMPGNIEQTHNSV